MSSGYLKKVLPKLPQTIKGGHLWQYPSCICQRLASCSNSLSLEAVNDSDGPLALGRSELNKVLLGSTGVPFGTASFDWSFRKLDSAARSKWSYPCHQSFSTSSREIRQDPGQVNPWRHPELVQPGDLTPGIPAREYANRRSALLATMPAKSLAIIPAAPIKYMAGIIPYPYRQNADYFYLSGCQQPRGVVVLLRHEGAESRFAMYMPPRDRAKEVWDGYTADPEAATAYFGADEGLPLTSLPLTLTLALQNGYTMFYDTGKAEDLNLYTRLPVLSAAIAKGQVKPLAPLIHQLRWRKSDAEVLLLRKSAKIAAEAFVQAMRSSVKETHEHTIAATFEYECKRRGAQRMSYPPVVGSGEDACTIHYSRNDKQVKQNDLVLMDGGCEVHGYASDITRTWPINGRFSAAQRDVYSTVLEVWHKCLEQIRVGSCKGDLHTYSAELISKGLAKLGMPQGSYTRFYPHSIGHWLGLDVHDSAMVPSYTPLEPGVVLAFEPGIYIPNEPDIPEKYRGIGVRIEDDILVTDQGPEVLSCGVPREVDDIERLLVDGH